MNGIFTKIRLLALVAWMIVIFTFSARPADLSEQDSNRVGMLVGRILISEFEEWTPEEQTEFAESIDHLVRKIAHGTEYAILAILWLNFLHDVCPFRLPLSWILSTVYAATDEFHQLFVVGRSCQLTDVIIDSLGAAIGLCLAILLMRILKYTCDNLKTERRH